MGMSRENFFLKQQFGIANNQVPPPDPPAHHGGCSIKALVLKRAPCCRPRGVRIESRAWFFLESLYVDLVAHMMLLEL